MIEGRITRRNALSSGPAYSDGIGTGMDNKSGLNGPSGMDYPGGLDWPCRSGYRKRPVYPDSHGDYRYVQPSGVGIP